MSCIDPYFGEEKKRWCVVTLAWKLLLALLASLLPQLSNDANRGSSKSSEIAPLSAPDCSYSSSINSTVSPTSDFADSFLKKLFFAPMEGEVSGRILVSSRPKKGSTGSLTACKVLKKLDKPFFFSLFFWWKARSLTCIILNVKGRRRRGYCRQKKRIPFHMSFFLSFLCQSDATYQGKRSKQKGNPPVAGKWRIISFHF